AAKGLAESVETSMARFGGRVHAALQRLCHMGTERPTVGQWRAWYARFRSLVNQHAAREDKGGTLVRRLEREGVSPGGAGPVIASHLSHPGASDFSDPGRSGVMSVQRRGP